MDEVVGSLWFDPLMNAVRESGDESPRSKTSVSLMRVVFLTETGLWSKSPNPI